MVQPAKMFEGWIVYERRFGIRALTENPQDLIFIFSFLKPKFMIEIDIPHTPILFLPLEHQVIKTSTKKDLFHVFLVASVKRPSSSFEQHCRDIKCMYVAGSESGSWAKMRIFLPLLLSNAMGLPEAESQYYPVRMN